MKRFCALDPPSCFGLVPLVDAGECEKACKMTCTQLRDGSERCVAVSCADPSGRVWESPITTFVRNRIEAVNANELSGAVATDEALGEFKDGAAATYRLVDFGSNGVTTFSARVAGALPGGRIEIWLDGARRIGVLELQASRETESDQEAPLDAAGVSGLHDVELKFSGRERLGSLVSIALR